MKVVCVIPCHERLEISVASINLLKKYQTLKPITIVVGWSSIEKKIAQLTGSHFVECKNTHLGNKWQTGIDFARTLEPDALLILGSDTWLTKNWIKFCALKIAEGVDLLGKIQWYACNLRSNRIEIIQRGYLKSPAKDFPVGGGRMISKSLLDRMNWNLFPRDKKSCLDITSANLMKLHDPIVEIFNTNKHIVMGIKGPWATLNPFSRIKNADSSVLEHLEGVSSADICRWLQVHFPGSLSVIKSLGLICR